MKKRNLELKVLDLAKTELDKLYGFYNIDESQNDRPDAAINVIEPRSDFDEKNPSFKVGIEITSVDKEDVQAYFNDQTYGINKINEAFAENKKNGGKINHANKKMEIFVDEFYIYEGAMKKLKKHEDYAKSNIFKDIILICHSENTNSNKLLREWTNFLLSKENFPFDKVLFTALETQKCFLIYEKKKPLLTEPRPFNHVRHQRAEITIPIGHHNILGALLNEPIIQPKKSAKRTKKH
ncbi:hypothetical protein J4E05_16360 [Thalassospira sp. NFXS8]|uniref:hypothetical protein n=1 Tax=Thalassospira sp. NFXS8 TaxID=2819093 RepID=UPI0032DFCC6D